MSFTPNRRSALKLTAAASAASALTAAATTNAHANGQKRIAIIGSGYGGAVAARALTEKGYTVDMIEMGADWEKMAAKSNGYKFDQMTSPTERSMWFEDRTDMPLSSIAGMDFVNRAIGRAAGVLGVERFANMKVYVGKGVGGGSLANGGMAVTPTQSYFHQVLPQLDAAEMYATYFPRANANLGVNVPPSDIVGTSKWYQFSRLSASQAAKAGFKHQLVPNVYDWNYMRQENFARVPRSALGGQVIFGNDYGKKSLPKTILATAFATGKVNLTTMTEVTSITQQADGTFSLDLKTIDFKGNLVSNTKKVYDRVIMAAGSVGTNRLLLQAKNFGTIKNLPATLGTNWGPNGNIMVARNMNAATGGYQSGIPAMGVSNWDDSTNSVFAELAPFPAGIDMRIGLYLAITNNPNKGKFTWNNSTGSMELDWDSTKAAPGVAAAKAFMDKINAANPGTSYNTGLFKDGKTFADYFTYHPLGGAVIGETTDLNGEVKGVPGLFIMDGSLIPGKIGVNPFVTITAIAERNMDRLLAAGRFS